MQTDQVVKYGAGLAIMSCLLLFVASTLFPGAFYSSMERVENLKPVEQSSMVARTFRASSHKPTVRFDPVPCRDDFASLAQKEFIRTGIAVEVGVFTGDFSAKNLREWHGTYYMVDAWTFRPNDPGDKNVNDPTWNNNNKQTATDNTAFAGDRRKIVQALSQEGAKTFADSSIDWLYLDALHTREAVLKDLAAWWPKVRPGGLVTGDDYGDESDNEMVSAARWSAKFSEVQRDPANRWGVISALHQFFNDSSLDLHVTWMDDCYKWPAWYIVKPHESAKALVKANKVRFDPVPCRDDFADLAQRLFTKTGVAVEVGVYTGDFSAKNLGKWQGTYYMVDAWAWRPNDPADKNMNDVGWNERNKKQAEDVTAFAGDRRKTIQALSHDGAKSFSDASIDWLYLDALHTREAVLKDLAAWWPKVRPGGLVTGDDYGDEADTEMVTADRWSNKFGQLQRDPANRWGVISALHEFCNASGLELHVTWMNDCYPWPAWYLVKPEA